jgi:hypothetical protein
MADPAAPQPQARPAAPPRSLSDSIPVDIYAQFGSQSREDGDGDGQDAQVATKGRVS